MAITATMAEAQNDYCKAMRAGKREGEILPNLDDILKEKNITQKQQECNFSLILRSCFKFIPRQIETYVEADWSPRYAVNSGLLTKIKGFKMRDRSSIWPEHTCLK